VEIRWKRFSATPNKMLLLFYLTTLTTATTSSKISENLNFRVEKAEFNILLSADTSIIDRTISHATKLQEAVHLKFPKLVKPARHIFKSLTRATDIRKKFILVSGERNFNKRNIVTDFTGAILGGSLGLATEKHVTQIDTTLLQLR
jgi:hypothetical protein